MELANRIRECVSRAGGGGEMSRKTGIPRGTLEDYLTGKSEPKASRLAAIAKAADASLDWLVTGSDPTFKTGKNKDITRLWSSIVIEELARFVKKMKLDLPAYEWPVVYNECMDRMEKIAPTTDDVEHLKIIAAGILIQGWDESVQRAARDK